MSAPIKTRRAYGTGKDGKKRVGVTDVLKTLGWNTEGLVHWATGKVLDAVLAGLDEGGAPEDVVRRARFAHKAARNAAADAGTLAHAYIDAFLVTGKVLPEDPWEGETEQRARASLNRFRTWWQTAGYEVVDTELPIVDEDLDFGGTIDLVLRRKSDNALLVADVKTGKVHDEMLVQLGAYAGLLAKRRTPVVGGLILHAPVDADFDAIEVTRAQLDVGAAIFAALLCVHRFRGEVQLNAKDGGGTP